ncbi:MAG: heparinase II/III family protein, partial [Candidatus Omnitrophica bacterium]|nr:heparinase II/III family protein [Candidatus Omnitrophota bacterium]
QRALIFAALARDQGPVEEWLDSVVRGIHPDIRHTGLEYALYNLVYQDGIPYETSPGYNFSWIRNITEIAETLKWAGRNMYEHPKMKTLYEGVLDVVQCGQHTPSLGDSGIVWGGLVGQDAYTFQAAYRAYGDERYRRFLQKFGATGESGFNTFETLFYPMIEPTTESLQPQEPRLLDGYGMAILNNASDTVSMSLYYGYKGGHGHFDRLHFDLFANGWPMTPDLGYPDFMNAYVPGIYSWSKNTISHNTVTVDAGRQVNNEKGAINYFSNSDRVRWVEVEAPETYPQCATYRRLMMMVDVDEEHSYFVDFFTVEGGDQHDYSLHGPPGECESIGGEWTKPGSGTLAGATVEVGALYDDPARSVEGFDGTYYGYMGSGFQHFIHPQRLLSGEWIAEYHHAKDSDARLRIRILPTQDQEIILADAQVSPVKHKDLVKYVIARRKGEDLNSLFVSVLEPYSEEPFIDSATCEKTDDGIVLHIDGVDGVADSIIYKGAETGARLVRHNRSNGSRIERAPEITNKNISDEVVRIGKPHITSASGARVTTDAQFEFGPTYAGCFLTDKDFTEYFKIEDAGRDHLDLIDPLPEGHPFRVGEDAWVVRRLPHRR